MCHKFKHAREENIPHNNYKARNITKQHQEYINTVFFIFLPSKLAALNPNKLATSANI
jgi:hypothetical protein